MAYRASILVAPYIQPGTITITVVGAVPVTGTATITAVDTAASAVQWCGQSALDTNNRPAEFVSLVLTNATTVTGSLYGAVAGTEIVGFQVLTWHPSVLRSLQTFSITMTESGALSNTATLVTPVTLNKSMIILGGYAANGSVVSSVAAAAVQQRVALTSTTTVTSTRAQATGAGCIVTGTIVEFR